MNIFTFLKSYLFIDYNYNNIQSFPIVHPWWERLCCLLLVILAFLSASFSSFALWIFLSRSFLRMLCNPLVSVLLCLRLVTIRLLLRALICLLCLASSITFSALCATVLGADRLSLDLNWCNNLSNLLYNTPRLPVNKINIFFWNHNKNSLPEDKINNCWVNHVEQNRKYSWSILH